MLWCHNLLLYIRRIGMVTTRGPFYRLHGQTDELVDWISKVRVKKNSMRRLRRKNLRIEAVLRSSLVKAESLLRVKQQQRYQRWQRLKVELRKADNLSVFNASCSYSHSSQWDEKTCEDINSINSFMCSLKVVKSLVRR